MLFHVRMDVNIPNDLDPDVRADTVGPDPRFISMIGEFVEAYAGGLGDLSAMGCGDNGSTCRDRCCVPAARPRSAARPSDRA